MNDKNKFQDELANLAQAQEVPGDPPVYYAQVWLNETYGNISNWVTLAEDGLTGQGTMGGLVRALQHELGTGVDGGFGAGTEAAFESFYSSTGGQLQLIMSSENNMNNIVKAALWCKGYYGYVNYNYDGHIDQTTFDGLEMLKEDAGIDGLLGWGVISAKLMKSLLSMDQFVLVESAGGKSDIREIQQYLNANFGDYIGIIPCDGIYQRSMNEALIKRLQYIEGQRGSAVDGIFGSGTQNLLPILNDSNHPAEAVRLFNFCLTCNGYNSSGTAWTSDVKTQACAFQSRYLIAETGNGDVDTWMALLLSKGNPNRAAQGCDCATILDEAKANALYAAGYRYVGRYLSGTVGSGPSVLSKAMTKSEMTAIFNAGLRIFAIFQEGVPSLQRYTYELGKEDATKAISAAKSLDIPMREYIYFAVDYDVLDGYISSTVKPYFEGINEAFEDNGHIYNIGIYGSRNVCSRICSEYGLASSCFVGDMSTGFSGNMGFPLPECWAFDQFHEYSFSYNYGLLSFPLDKDAVSGRYCGFNKFGGISDGAVPVTDRQKREEVYKIIDSILNLAGADENGNIHTPDGKVYKVPIDESGIAWNSPPIVLDVGAVKITLSYKHSELFDLNNKDDIVYTASTIENGFSPEFSASASYASDLFDDIAEGLSTEISIGANKDDWLSAVAQVIVPVSTGKVYFGVKASSVGALSAFITVESYLGTNKNIENSVSVKIEITTNVQTGSGIKDTIDKYLTKENVRVAVACATIAVLVGVAAYTGALSLIGAAVIQVINSISAFINNVISVPA